MTDDATTGGADARDTLPPTASAPTLADIRARCPALPTPPQGDSAGFDQPWQASVFAMTVQLHERGIFTWRRWADALGARLAGSPRDTGDPAAAQSAPYYEAWADALVDVLEESGLVDAGVVAATEQRWHEAAARTPHGTPIDLSRCAPSRSPATGRSTDVFGRVASGVRR